MTRHERETAAIRSCQHWMEHFKFGREYAELIKFLDDDDAETVRRMLQRAVLTVAARQSTVVTSEDIDRQYCNLLDSHRLELFEARAAAAKSVALAAEEAQSKAEQEQAKRDAAQRQLNEQSAFEKGIADRAAEDCANKKIPIKELRRRALFTERNERGRIETTPMPASIQIFSRSPKQK